MCKFPPVDTETGTAEPAKVADIVENNVSPLGLLQQGRIQTLLQQGQSRKALLMKEDTISPPLSPSHDEHSAVDTWTRYGRNCKHKDCGKVPQGNTQFCKAHGGGRRCQFDGCTKCAQASTQFCVGHGGGRRCQFEGGCTKSAQGKTLFCVAHGGGRRCMSDGCKKSAIGNTNSCIAHATEKRGLVDERTNVRADSVNFEAYGTSPCHAPGCGKLNAEGSLFCYTHLSALWGLSSGVLDDYRQPASTCDCLLSMERPSKQARMFGAADAPSVFNSTSAHMAASTTEWKSSLAQKLGLKPSLLAEQRTRAEQEAGLGALRSRFAPPQGISKGDESMGVMEQVGVLHMLLQLGSISQLGLDNSNSTLNLFRPTPSPLGHVSIPPIFSGNLGHRTELPFFPARTSLAKTDQAKLDVYAQKLVEDALHSAAYPEVA